MNLPGRSPKMQTFPIEDRGTMDAKQLTSGLFEVDLGAISAERHKQALRTLSSNIDDKELLGLLKIQLEDLHAPTRGGRRTAEAIAVPAAAEAAARVK